MGIRYTIYDNLESAHDFQYELAFTKAYRDSGDAYRCVREARCLELYIPEMLRPVQPNDLFVGRRVYPTLGVSPMYWNDETDGLDHIGYYADFDRMEAFRSRTKLPEETAAAVDEMIAFWKGEHSNGRVRAAFDAQMQREMPSDLWNLESGVIFCLYRLAGAPLDYEKLVEKGLPGLKQEIEQRRQRGRLTDEQNAFLDSLKRLIDVIEKALLNYAQELARMAETDAAPQELLKMREICLGLCEHAPRTLREGIQLVWLYSAISGTNDFNRTDMYLGHLYAQDVRNGVLSEDEAIALLSSFFDLMRETHVRDTRVIIGGVGRKNEEECDAFGKVVIKTCMKLRQINPQLTLRMYPGMNPEIRDMAMDLLESGMTYPLLYNDAANIPSVMKTMRIDREEAQQYCFFGCGEYIINHKSMGTPNNIINLLKALEVTLHNGVDPVTARPSGLALGEFRNFKTFDELYGAYRTQVEYFARISARHQKLVYDVVNEQASMLMMSLLMDDCIERAKGVLDGGVVHLAGTYETYGNVSTADSLAAIREAVYNRQLFTQDELLQMLDCDFEGYEEQRKLLLSMPKFGNDDPSVDQLVRDIDEHIASFTAAQAEVVGLDSYLVVIINNSANTVLGRHTAASADGRRAFTYMSNGNGPMAGMDRKGILPLINSLSAIDPSITGGVAENLKFTKEMFSRHRAKLNSLIDIMFDRGTLSLNISVVDPGELQDAMAHPERHQNLMVRVGGFSARFVTLEKDVQEDVLRRTLYGAN